MQALGNVLAICYNILITDTLHVLTSEQTEHWRHETGERAGGKWGGHTVLAGERTLALHMREQATCVTVLSKGDFYLERAYNWTV